MNYDSRSIFKQYKFCEVVKFEVTLYRSFFLCPFLKRAIFNIFKLFIYRYFFLTFLATQYPIVELSQEFVYCLSTKNWTPKSIDLICTWRYLTLKQMAEQDIQAFKLRNPKRHAFVNLRNILHQAIWVLIINSGCHSVYTMVTAILEPCNATKNPLTRFNIKYFFGFSLNVLSVWSSLK